MIVVTEATRTHGRGPSLRTRVTVLGAVGVLVVLSLATVVWSAFTDLREASRIVAEQIQPAIGVSTDLAVAYDRVDRESRAYIFTGDKLTLTGYRDALRQAQQDASALGPLVRSNPELASQLEQLLAASAHWIPATVEPALSLRAKRELKDAELRAFIASTTSGYVLVAAPAATLDNGASNWQRAEFDQIAALAQRLAIALVVSGISMLALVFGAYLLVRRWVLTPLDTLRLQLREVAQDGHRDQVIVPSGPPELHAAGVDAEAMRRAIVSAADAARAAGEGLAQEGPVVSALRAELATQSNPIAPHVAIHGHLQPAEGVLAGDWWGLVHLDGDRTGLVLIDVSGHGELAGLVTLRLRDVMTVALRSGFDAATTLKRAAASMTDAIDGRFATALVIVLDPLAGELSWANAGHPGGWLLTGGHTHDRLVLAPTGPLVSVLGGEWTTERATFAERDLVLLWSDGLTEAHDADREIGDDALADAIIRAGTHEPGELVPHLLAHLRERSPGWHRDDITVVAVRRTS